MVAITMPNGQVANIRDESISAAHKAYDPHPRPTPNVETAVFGPTNAALIAAEPPESLIGRLVLQVPLAILTRPDGTPVWIKGPAVTLVREPLRNEIPPAPFIVRATVIAASRRYTVQQDPLSALQILRAVGAGV